MFRYRIRSLQIVLAILTLMALCVRRAAMAEEKGLNGRWKVVNAMQGGKPIKDAVGEFATFLDARWVQEDKRGKVTNTGTVTIEWDNKPPTIDIIDDSGGTNIGVIELRDDSLEICWGYSKRPTSLDSSKDKMFVYFHFARIPDK